MKIHHINGKDYRLPGSLNRFQQGLYVHLINWKWKHLTEEVGYSNYKGRSIPYDAILPERMAPDLPVVYRPVRDNLRQHHRKNTFREHTYFNHMASSQAANINLFLPVLHHAAVSNILRHIKPDFASLAIDQLDHGYCLEFWGGNFGSYAACHGPLGDKSGSHGTDTDIAIAYRNHGGELCLWLIEHKLAEREFTPCSGPKSHDRDRTRHACSSSFADILRNKHTCFHHDFKKRKYWDITEGHLDFFVNPEREGECPFQGGMNQLWRNLLLALAVEQDEGQPYAHATFSVVKHPANPHLNETLSSFEKLIGNNPGFSVFNSDDVLRAAEVLNDKDLNEWAKWYRDLYNL